MSRPHEPGSSPARDAVRQRTGARRNDDEEDGGRTGGRRTDEQMADDGDGERASDHDEDEGEDYEDDSNDEDEGENEEEEDDEGEGASDDSKGQAADEAMHANKGLPCVPVGENFTVRGTEFKRTATKQAQCMRCNHRFMPKGYGQHIAKHAVYCARVARQKEEVDATRAQAKSDAKDPEVRFEGWVGQRTTVSETVEGTQVAVEFENIMIGERIYLLLFVRLLLSPSASSVVQTRSKAVDASRQKLARSQTQHLKRLAIFRGRITLLDGTSPNLRQWLKRNGRRMFEQRSVPRARR